MRNRLAFGVMFLGLLSGCSRPQPEAVPTSSNTEDRAVTASSPKEAATTAPLSEEESVTAKQHGFQFEVDSNCGVDFLYYGNPSDERYMTEQNGGGVAIMDFDQDDLGDLFLANGSHFDRPADEVSQTHRAFRNRTFDSRSLRFTDASHNANLDSTGFGMGCAAADFNNDGFTDLLLCEYRRIRLWQNQGDGTFLDVSATSELSTESWAAGAAWADLDQDGDLEVYVTNYVTYDRTTPPCYTQHVTPVQISCGPVGLPGEPDQLWENRGDGTFADVCQTSGIRSVEAGKGLAVEIADLDGDDQLDIYVANDTTPNLLFKNTSGLQFTEVGLTFGVALGADGRASSSMGIACADFDRNALFDLFVTNFENSINDYYSAFSPGVYFHSSAITGLDTTSRPMLAFGTVAADFDLDQNPDLMVANGHIWDLRSLGFGHEYEMTPQLFWNRDGQRFTDVSADSGPFFREKWLGRAVATGDLDNDGDSDLIMTNLLKKTSVVVNKSERRGASVRLRTIGRNAARQPLGVRVICRLADKTYHHHIPSGGSFAATHDPRILLSVGSATKIDELSVCWGDGMRETWTDLSVQPDIVLIEGTGKMHQAPEIIRP
jgi:hypothetical protein